MLAFHDVITGLTTDSPTLVDKSVLLKRFANTLGWSPSYHLNPQIAEANYVTIHLVVEHGLENTAILTFLKGSYSELTESERNRLLNLSYNNMVDWHIHVEREKVTYVYNRLTTNNNVILESPFRRDQYDNLRSEAFDKIVGRRVSPNIPSLDDCLINTISYWKRAISSELGDENINEALASLFNSIIFVRAIEDNIKVYQSESEYTRILPAVWNELKDDETKGIAEIINTALERLNYSIPSYLIDVNELEKLRNINKQTISFLIGDFYDNRQTNLYKYDFSVMSKHALSRIYERYIALLKVQDEYQLSIFPSFKNLAKEENSKIYGSVFTPQYIGRFFAQYLKENLSPIEFKNIKVFEPAVGSGIFLRSILEIKCDPSQEYISDEQIEQAFQDILGIDIDPNATKATELSLALLQLVLLNKFPTNLNIFNRETIELVVQHPELSNSYDVVVSNPPFIASSAQSEEMKKRINTYMGEMAIGRVDTYLAFLKLSLEILKPGGYGLFVLPHSFMVADSAEKMRNFIYNNCWIKCIADLSAIEVFGNTGIYVILLIVQKKSEKQFLATPTTVIKCRDSVGKALQTALKNVEKENDFYSVYQVDQSSFQGKKWFILPSKEVRIQNKLSHFPKIGEYLEVRQGFVSGNDNVFIRKGNDIRQSEMAIYVPYIPDKLIDSYNFDKDSNLFLFYPFINGEKLEEEEMISSFPETWAYLISKKNILMSKKSFQYNLWWKPLRPRQPEQILRSKIITPHLTITPKFALDIEGKYTVSRSPYLISKNDEVEETDLLLYFVGILNSTPCYWYISNHSHKYSQGYNMLEVKTLIDTPVPDVNKVPATTMRKLLKLVRERIKRIAYDSYELDKEIDAIAAELYGFSMDDQRTLGII